MNVIDDVGRHIHRALKTEGDIGAPKIVVDGLGQSNHRNSLFPQQIGGFVGAVAPQDHQTVQLEGSHGFLHGRHLIHPVPPDDPHQLKGLAGGAQHRTALGENAGKILRLHLAGVAADKAPITVDHAVDLHLVKGLVQRLGDAADGGVEALTIPAAG